MNKFILNGIASTIAEFVGKYAPVEIALTAKMPVKDGDAIFKRLNATVVPASLVGIKLGIQKGYDTFTEKTTFIITIGAK